MRTNAIPVFGTILLLFCCTCPIWAQPPAEPPALDDANKNLNWRPVNGNRVGTRQVPSSEMRVQPAVAPNVEGVIQLGNRRPPNSNPAGVATHSVIQTGAEESNQGSVANAGGSLVTSRKLDTLPNSAGQVWREYDIRGYTSRVTSTQKPQQAIIDWILRDTGTEMWFNEPLGILSATRDSLFVYHTPEIQDVVRKTVERFSQTRGEVQTMGIRLVTVGNPNWRAAAYSMMQPIDVQSPGVEGWMISKENAALLINQLRRRGDFQQHNMGSLNNHDGQKLTLNRTRPIDFIRSIRWNAAKLPPYDTIPDRIDEGYSLEISSLTSVDGKSVDAVINCRVDQVERLQTVNIDVPSASGRLQRVELKIPQIVSWRLNERFRWSTDQVLLLSCGVVATPTQEKKNGLNLQLFNRSRGRADALLFIDHQGRMRQATVPQNWQRSDLAPVNPRR